MRGNHTLLKQCGVTTGQNLLKKYCKKMPQIMQYTVTRQF